MIAVHHNLKIGFALLTVLLLLCGCQHSSIHRQLIQADSVMASENLDSAYHILSGIDTTRIMAKADRIYYQLIEIQLLYRMRKPADNMEGINECVSYYAQERKDVRKLAQAYYYRGMLEYESGKVDKAVTSLKKAEEAAQSLYDIDLKHKIYDSLSTLNFLSGNINLARKYTLLSLECAKLTSNGLWFAYAYNHLACIYEAMGRKDSSWVYIKKSLPYIQTVDAKDRAEFLYMVGENYHHNNENSLAKQYLLLSSKAYPTPATYNILASIYNQEGMKDTARALWRKAMGNASLDDKVDILDTIANQRFSEGDFRGAYWSLKELILLKDSIEKQKQTFSIQEIQLKYDQQKTKRNYDRMLIRGLYALIVLIVIIAALIIFYVFKANNNKRKVIAYQILINDYNRKISELQKSGSDAEKDIRRLKHKVEKIQSQQTGVMFEGHSLYEEIIENKPIVKWNKSDVAKFIEYYKVVNLPFVTQLNTDYVGLTNGNKLFLILQDMGKKDEEIMQILGTSYGAIRTTRHRLKAKLKDKEQ